MSRAHRLTANVNKKAVTDYIWQFPEVELIDSTSAATTTADSATIASYDITTQSEAGQFAIDPSSGVITLGKALDYETKTHTFTVTATSTDGVSATQDYTITISDDTTEGPVVAAVSL